MAPALALVGQSARPRHQGQIAVLVGRIPQIGYTLEARAPQQAGFPVGEGVEALAAVVRAHPAGTCQRRQQRLAVLRDWGIFPPSADVPTPPNGRATIRLCRTLSLEQKLPLEVSFISLEMTCQADPNRNAKELGSVPAEGKRVRRIPLPWCCWNRRTRRGASPAC